MEDSAELKLSHENLCRLEARPANVEGQGRITIRDLVINTLRMRPDRIIVGEVVKLDRGFPLVRTPDGAADNWLEYKPWGTLYLDGQKAGWQPF